jgi:hypothetical protein
MPEQQEEIAKQLYQVASNGFRPNGQADVALYCDALQKGLESWARGLIFPKIAPAYVVAEAQPTKRGVMQSTLLRSWNTFNTIPGGHLLAPVSEENWIYPTSDNKIEIRRGSADRDVFVVIKLSKSYHDIKFLDGIEQPDFDLTLMAEGPEAALQCDLFCDLLQGRWPEGLAFLDNHDVWPKTGLRPIWHRRLYRQSPGAIDVLDANGPALAGRIIRLPWKALAPFWDSKNSELVIPVAVRDASSTTATLNGRVFANHIVCWNRRLLLFDRPDLFIVEAGTKVTTVSDFTDGVVLQCWDRRDMRQYHDARWASWVDPAFQFTTQLTSNSKLAIEFASTVSKQLVIIALETREWPKSPEWCNSEEIACEEDDTTKLVVRTEPLSALQPVGLESQQTACLAAGRGMLPTAPVVTADDLVETILRCAPEALLGAFYAAGRNPRASSIPSIDVHIENCLNRDGGFSFPLTVITLPTTSGLSDIDSAYYCEWLARTIETRCQAGTQIEIRVGKVGT